MPTYDGVILLGDTGEPVPYLCAMCGAMGRGLPPHGWDEPCPQKTQVDEAYVAKLDAERMYYVRNASSSETVAGSYEQIGEALRRVAGGDE